LIDRESTSSTCGAPTNYRSGTVNGNFTNKKFLTPEEAAKYLGGLNSRTVTRWAREGYLPSYPIGEGKRRLWRFLTWDLDGWMASRRTGAVLDPLESFDTLAGAVDAPIGGFAQ
jgi:excisionase family DNA binding protein